MPFRQATVQISSTPIVSYRDSRRCSGATLPVRLMNCQGGSASTVANARPRSASPKSATGSKSTVTSPTSQSPLPGTTARVVPPQPYHATADRTA